MEIRVIPGDSGASIAPAEVVSALGSEGLKSHFEQADWGAWIHLTDYRTAISVETERKLIHSAVLEIDELEEESLQPRLFKAFASLGWQGEDEDGSFALV